MTTATTRPRRRERWRPTTMRLRGDPPRDVHHRRRARNVDFYTRVLGLRLVKKTVNQDDPTVYHLFYADEAGSAGRRHHLLRVPRRAPRARGRRDGAHVSFRVGLRRGARRSGRQRLAAEGDRRRPRATAGCGSRIPRASASSSSSPTSTTRRSSPATRRSRPSTRSRASTASARSRSRPAGEPRAARETCSGFAPTGEASWEVRGAVARRPLRVRPAARRRAAASPAPARCTTSPGPRR